MKFVSALNCFPFHGYILHSSNGAIPRCSRVAGAFRLPLTLLCQARPTDVRLRTNLNCSIACRGGSYYSLQERLVKPWLHVAGHYHTGK